MTKKRGEGGLIQAGENPGHESTCKEIRAAHPRTA